MSAGSGSPARFGRYTVLRPLAQGGMAELYLARQDGPAGFEKLVVVKRVLAELARDPEIVKMLGDEARIGARLEHPNIVSIYELGEQDGQAYYVMEFLEGENLRNVLRRVLARERAFPIDIVLAIVEQVARGLHYAHEARGPDGLPLEIVHRDVSPHNVIVTYEGTVKLVDFGIAKARRRHAAKTRTGALKGKLSYMSPEQVRSRPLDRRSDVFSLGIVLWELITGTKLFNKADDFSLMSAVVQDAILPVTVYTQDAPPELEAVIQRALTREVDLRFQTAADLADALHDIAYAHGLDAGSLQIADFMARMFPDRVDAWRAAHDEGGSAIVRHFSQPALPTLDPETIGEAATEASGGDAKRLVTPHGPTTIDLRTPARAPAALLPTPATGHFTRESDETVPGVPTLEQEAAAPTLEQAPLLAAPSGKRKALLAFVGVVLGVGVSLGVWRWSTAQTIPEPNGTTSTAVAIPAGSPHEASPPKPALGADAAAATQAPDMAAPSPVPPRAVPTPALAPPHRPPPKRPKGKAHDGKQPSFDPDSALPALP